MQWDLFCAVVDNFGDAGVCWRLARQLACDPRNRVTLYIDDPEPLKVIAGVAIGGFDGPPARVRVRAWTDAWGHDEPVGDVIIEAFGCALPDTVLDRMEERATPCVWINLEYLSAEPWVATHHALTSPHSQRRLTKQYFFPGFTDATGGLLREPGLARLRAQFTQSQLEQTAFWRQLGMTLPRVDEIRVSLFAYTGCAVQFLLDACAQRPNHAWTILVADGVLPALGEGTQGNVTIRRYAWLDQDAFDRLLWACDFNFVRGEDSFVRAQFAAKPLVWNIYPQLADAHRPKLDAFVSLYCAGDTRAYTEITTMWQAWNDNDPAFVGQWLRFFDERHRWERHASYWCDALFSASDLVERLNCTVQRVLNAPTPG